ASKSSYFEVIKQLLIARANVNTDPTREFTSRDSYLEVVKQLLIATANVNAGPTLKFSGRTALQVASGGSHLEVVKRLQEALNRLGFRGS
ncbi:hypothetical protein C8A01DRAFT_21589, partial [Parachaetomium inaequale]